jgi:hypothetical protein
MAAVLEAAAVSLATAQDITGRRGWKGRPPTPLWYPSGGWIERIVSNLHTLRRVRWSTWRRPAALALAASTFAFAANANAAYPRPPAHVSARVWWAVRAVPPAFLGLSIEPLELSAYAKYLPTFSNLLDAIEPHGDTARPILRVGGDSADSMYLGPDPYADVDPEYEQSHPFVVSPEWFGMLGDVVRATNSRLLFDLNLASHSPTMAAHVSQDVALAVPRDRILAFEIGNEPDLYANTLVGLSRAVPGGANSWALDFTIQDYVSLFAEYVAAVRQVLPHSQFAGPDGMSRSPYWVSTFVESQDLPLVSLVTAHNYPPFEGCALPGEPKYPRPAGYMADSVAQGVAHSERYVLGAADLGGLNVRLSEVGSSVCGGVSGRSDTFATALWAPDLLFNLMSVGVSGINMHLRGNGFANTALNVTQDGIYAEPLYYGMALFARMLGPGAKLMLTTKTGGPERLKVWAVRLGDGTVNVLYLNKSNRDTLVTLPALTSQAATVQRLSASSLSANDTVALAGQRLDGDGRWSGTLDVKRVPSAHGSYRVLVPAFSAAMLSVPPFRRGLTVR